MMCGGDCSNGTCIYIAEGQAYATWPSSDVATTAAVQEALTEQGIVRGSD